MDLNYRKVSWLVCTSLLTLGISLSFDANAVERGPRGNGRGLKNQHPQRQEQNNKNKEGNNNNNSNGNSDNKIENRGQDLRDKIREEMERRRTMDPGVNARQQHQESRIAQGVKSGQLTKDETKELQTEEKSIRQEEKEYKSDGKLTKDERKDLHQDLNEVSKDIYQEKHDAETQPGVVPAKPGTHDPSINNRQENQQDRIKQGIESGELTKHEVKSLEQKEAKLASIEKRMKEDGSLSAEERARLQKYADLLSADIYKQKHDNQEQK